MSDTLAIITTVMRASSHRFVGRLGRDPEVRYFEGGKSVSNASIGINIPGSKQGDGKQPDWFKVEIWGDDGQNFSDQCRKGDLVEVIGRVKTSRWTDRNTGEERQQLVITADQWSLVRSSDQGQAGAPAPAGAPAAAPPPAPAPAPEAPAPSWANEEPPF